MARKIDVKRILELRAAGMSQNTIAASRHASKHSVGDVFRIADEKGITYDSIAALSPGEVYRMFFPDRHSVETLYERPDYEYVHKELMERRSDSTSTVFCTQYRKEDWVKRLGKSVQAEAIVDRYAYSAYWIEMGTKNMREYCSNLPQ